MTYLRRKGVPVAQKSIADVMAMKCDTYRGHDFSMWEYMVFRWNEIVPDKGYTGVSWVEGAD